MDDSQILQSIHALVADEHDLRRRVAAGELDLDSEHRRLAELERSLDQCWDLLRQRRARREQGQDVEQGAARPTDQVEGYLQ